jgi:hypothetical protein
VTPTNTARLARRGFHIHGTNPADERADVADVLSTENRSRASTTEAKLERFADGTEFHYMFCQANGTSHADPARAHHAWLRQAC